MLGYTPFLQRLHLAGGALGVPTAPAWLPILIAAVAVVAIGLYWTSTRI